MPSPAHDRPPPLPPALLEVATEALAAAAAERTVALRTLQDAHPEHADALRRLCAELAAMERLLDTTYPARDAMPERVGPFRVLERLGEGAFGDVFLCAQETPVRRRVAVKVLRPGAGDRTTLDRFASERQVIASLQHPTIAQVFDAGALPDGRPYFVMDAIEGVPIGAYCDQKALTIGARLLLFLDLCRGVQHAHAHGVVHRDLKPANVLVVEHEGRPLPKIIDFGIAKVLVREPTRPSLFATEAGRIVGTPGYMSPEQATGRSEQVDARADVFALGVMLYQLLCGQLPWHDVSRVPDTDPPRPSHRVTTLRNTAAIANARASEPRRLASELRGDLDWIVHKCLRLDRAERYASVHALIDDVQRHLDGRPVHAGPPTLRYRLHKVARRHRRSLLVVAGGLALLILGVAASLQQRGLTTASEARRLDDALDAAEQLLQRARDPLLLEAPRRVELRRQLLQDALAIHERALHGGSDSLPQRQVRVRILSALVDVHYMLGTVAEGLPIAEQAVEQARLLVAADGGSPTARAASARAERNLARLWLLRGDHARAAQAGGRAIDLLEQLRAEQPGSHANLLAKALVEFAFASSRIGQPEAQLTAQRRAIAVLTDDLHDHPDSQETQRDLVRFHLGLAQIQRQDDLDQALDTVHAAQRLAATLPRVTAEEHALVSNRLGGLHEARGETRQALAAFANAAAGLAPLVQRDPGQLQLRATLADVQQASCRLHDQLGEFDQAVAHATAAVATVDGIADGVEGRTRRIVEMLLAVSRSCDGGDSVRAAAVTAPWLQRAAELAAAMPASEPRAAALRSRTAMHVAHVAALRGERVTAATWQQNLELARTAQEGSAEVECLMQLATVCADRGDADGARTHVAAARRSLAASPADADTNDARARLGRVAWRVELAAHDLGGVLAAVDELLAGEPEWQHVHHAADGCRAAALLARQSGDATAAERHEQRSRELYAHLVRGDGAPSGDGGLHELVVLQARLRLAGDDDAGERARGAALTRLDSLRQRVSLSWWDEALWVAANTAHVRTELRRGRPASAVQRVDALVAEPCSVDALLQAVDSWTECALCPDAGAATAQRASDGATDALARAIERGAGRARVQALDGVAFLRTLPRGRELLENLPR